MDLFPLIPLFYLGAANTSITKSDQQPEDYNKTLEMLAPRVFTYGASLNQCEKFEITHSPGQHTTVHVSNDLPSNTTNMRHLETELNDLYLRASKGCGKCTKACSNAIEDVCKGRDCFSSLKKKIKSGCKQSCKSQFD